MRVAGGWTVGEALEVSLRRLNPLDFFTRWKTKSEMRRGVEETASKY
jgi:hypothetical protein